jgi:hypothetical protein
VVAMVPDRCTARRSGASLPNPASVPAPSIRIRRLLSPASAASSRASSSASVNVTDLSISAFYASPRSGDETSSSRDTELVADENFADRQLHRAHLGVVGIVFMVSRQRADFIRGSFRIRM